MKKLSSAPSDFMYQRTSVASSSSRMINRAQAPIRTLKYDAPGLQASAPRRRRRTPGAGFLVRGRLRLAAAAHLGSQRGGGALIQGQVLL